MSFLSFSEETEDLQDKIDDLSGAVETYRDVSEKATASSADLAEKYGIAGEKARELFQHLQRLTEIEAINTIRESGAAIAATFEDALWYLDRLDDVTRQGFGTGPAAQRAIENLREEFGLTVAQAKELKDTLADQSAARTPQEMAEAMRRMADFLNEAARDAGYANENLNKAAKAASEATLESYTLRDAQMDAAIASDGLRISIAGIDFSNAIAGADGLASRISRMLGQARQLISALGQAANRQLSTENQTELLRLGV